MESFYITTAIDYVNGSPHLGHAYEKVLTDVIARFRRLMGDKVHFQFASEQSTPIKPASWQWVRLEDQSKADGKVVDGGFDIAFERPGTYSILLKDEGKSPAMAVISRGGLAVVLDRETKRSHLMRLARLNLRGRALQELQRWQTAGETNYFVLPMESYEFGE